MSAQYTRTHTATHICVHRVHRKECMAVSSILISYKLLDKMNVIKKRKKDEPFEIHPMRTCSYSHPALDKLTHNELNKFQHRKFIVL